MADAAKKPAGPVKLILLGCGALTGLAVLGMGGCGAIMYFVYKGTDPVAEVGASYLQNSVELKKALGESCVAKRNALGWSVDVQNDRGRAHISYTVTGSTGTPIGEAIVWLHRKGGPWEALGARVRRHAGADVCIGQVLDR